MSEKLIEIFSKNLNKYLDINGYTQADMVRYMRISSATASDWCHGKKMPRADKLQRLCAWFDIDLADLLTEQPYTDDPKRGYYYDPEANEIAEMLRINSNFRVLFDAARDSSPEDLLMAAELLNRFKQTNPDG